jgi:hypothetical protein
MKSRVSRNPAELSNQIWKTPDVRNYIGVGKLRFKQQEDIEFEFNH